MFADGIDSFYNWVKTRMASVNPGRKVLGLLDAQDWPSTNVVMEAFYLLTLKDASQNGTIANPIEAHIVQWVWVIKGSDLSQGQRGRNRGDRFRTAQDMKGELVQALYPNFAEKKSWQVDGNGRWIGTSHDPVEYIMWSKPDFNQRLDKENGIVYGACGLHITDFLDQIQDT